MSSEPLLVLALQQPSELLRDDGRYGNFRSPDFRRTLEFYASMFRRGWAPKMTNTQISNVWDEFGARHVLVLHLRAVEHRRVQEAAAAAAAGCVDDGADARSGRARRVQRRRREPGDLQSLADASPRPGR